MVITSSCFENRHGLFELHHLSDGGFTVPLGHSSHFYRPLDSGFRRVKGFAQRVNRRVARLAGVFLAF